MVPKPAGMELVKLLWLKSRTFNLLQRRIEAGIAPWSRFCERSKIWRRERLPS